MNTLSERLDVASAAGRNARQLILPYTLGLMALCAGLHLIIAATGGSPAGLFSIAALVVVAVYYASFNFLKKSVLKQVRFGPLVTHAITYVVVTGSYQLHAGIRTLTGSDALLGDTNFAVSPDWFGPTLAMAGFWSIGFTIHAVASVAQRGFED